MTLNGVMAIILRYFARAEFRSFCDQLHTMSCISGLLAINIFTPEKVLHQLSTTDALCSSR